MKVKNKKTFFFILTLICANIKAQQNLLLNYKNYGELVLKYNPIANAAENYKEIGKARLKAARGNYDPNIEGVYENKYFNDKLYYNVGNAQIKQPIFTSQYIKAGYEIGQGNFINPENYTPSYGLPYIGVEASLLQGLVFDKRRAEVIKGKFYKQYYNSERQIILNDILYSSSITYMELLYYKKLLNLNSFFFSIAKDRNEGLKVLSIAGERPAVDTIEANIFLQSRQLDLQAAEIELIKNKNDVLTYINQESESGLQINPMDSLDEYFTSALGYFGKWKQTDSVTNPQIQQYFAKQGILETEARLRKEQIKPKLDVGYNFLSDNFNNNSFSLNAYKWNATLSFPLFLRNPRNEFKIAKLVAVNNEYELVNKKNQINYKRKIILETGAIIAKQIINADASAKYSKMLLEAEKLKFENGESSLFMVNSRESKWLETEIKLAEYKLKFVKLVLQGIYNDGRLEYDLN
ncbi:MAG: TolC family protein [Bacteroidia bacterium]|nr:TolC family protein [Bacteroidia bacterium]